MKKYWKVVDLNLRSAIVRSKVMVQYKIGEFVTAPQHCIDRGYHLTIFETLKAARGFGGNGQIWECKIKGRVIRKRIPKRKFLDYRNDIIWENPSMDYPSLWKWPYGTVMAKAVQLVERIVR